MTDNPLPLETRLRSTKTERDTLGRETAWPLINPDGLEAASCIDELRTKLSLAISALEFYAEPASWHGVYMTGRSPMTDDWGGEEIDDQYPDGQTARDALIFIHRPAT